MKNAMKRVGLATAVFLAVAGSQAKADLVIGNVVATYNGNTIDNTIFQFNNTSGSALTGLTLSGLGISGTINGVTGSTAIPNIAAGGSFTFTFNGSGVFQSDFDDFHTGAVRYTLSGTSNGQAATAVFSPSSNASGGFVGFLGNDANGNEQDGVFLGIKVANITVAAVPEPSTISMAVIAGISGLVMYRRRKRTA
jgi:hypothetical protein